METYLEEDEDYQTQCGVIYFTSNSRLVFHCSLCEGKFQGFKIYEMHIKEHIALTFDEQLDEAYEPQSETDEGLKIALGGSVETNEGIDEIITPSLSIKEEMDSTDMALNEIELPFSHLKSMDKVTTVINSQRRKRLDLNSDNINSSKKLGASETLGKQKLYRNKTQQKFCSNDNVKIPTVVRAVHSRFHPRSMTSAEERKHKCPVCDVGFKDRHNMIHHLKRHSDNKDHKCQECGKGFYTSTEVRIHMRSHKNDRPFLCNMCGRSYTSNSHLQEHLKRHFNQRNYKCQICGKAFYNKNQLTGHMVGHTGERPFSCEICSASFSRQKALKNHIKLHENKREFKCELCDSQFNQRAGLFSHMKTTHKGF